MKQNSKHGIAREDYLLMARAYAKRGNELPHAKLDDDKVRMIRKSGTSKYWAEKFGCHKRTIDKVKQGNSWTHVI